MSVVTDYPDYSPHVATATQVAATGVPLLGKPAVLVPTNQASIAAGATRSYGVKSLTQIGYRAQFQVTFPAGTANPFVQVRLIWSDSATNTVVDNDFFYLPGATAPASFQAYGTGPAKADQVEMQITNLDLGQQVTVTAGLLQESMLTSTDRWTWFNAADSGLTVPGFTLPTLPNDQTVLGVLNAITVPAASNKGFLFGMAPGRLVSLTGAATGVTPASVGLIVAALPSSAYTNGAQLVNTTLTSAPFSFQFPAPRSPLFVEFLNNATSGTLTVSGMMTAQAA